MTRRVILFQVVLAPELVITAAVHEIVQEVFRVYLWYLGTLSNIVDKLLYLVLPIIKSKDVMHSYNQSLISPITLILSIGQVLLYVWVLPFDFLLWLQVVIPIILISLTCLLLQVLGGVFWLGIFSFDDFGLVQPCANELVYVLPPVAPLLTLTHVETRRFLLPLRPLLLLSQISLRV